MSKSQVCFYVALLFELYFTSCIHCGELKYCTILFPNAKKKSGYKCNLKVDSVLCCPRLKSKLQKNEC